MIGFRCFSEDCKARSKPLAGVWVGLMRSVNRPQLPLENAWLMHLRYGVPAKAIDREWRRYLGTCGLAQAEPNRVNVRRMFERQAQVLGVALAILI